MCFDSSPKKKKKKRPSSPDAQPVELAPIIPVPRGVQWVEPLRDLGYCHYIDVEGTEFMTPVYGIKHLRHQGPESREIAKMSACVEDGLLVVSEISTVQDPRSSGDRPLAAAILLSFWCSVLGRAVTELRTIRFRTVTEPTTMYAKDFTYNVMGREIGRPLRVRRRGDRPGEREAFRHTYNESKFGKCARTMVKWNHQMRSVSTKVHSFRFAPQDEYGYWFDFTVYLESDVSESDSQEYEYGHE